MKTRKITLVLAILLFNFSAFSQTINAGDIMPVVGDMYEADNFSSCNLDPGSANSNWDFTSLTPSTSTGAFTNTYQAASSTPYASSFTNCNIAAYATSGGQDSYSYFKTSANKMEMYGQVAAGFEIPFSNPITFMEFPMTYNATFNDTYGGVFVANGMVYHRSGTQSIEVDGAGTLSLSFGIYNDVLRVKSTRIEKDSVRYAGTDIVVHSAIEQYNYYKAGYHFPFVSQVKFYQEGVLVNQYTSVATSQTVGVTEAMSSVDARIFPNPIEADASLNIELSEFNSDVQIMVLDMKGSTVKVIEVEASNTQHIDLPLGNINKGVYFLQIMDSKGYVLKQEKLVVL